MHLVLLYYLDYCYQDYFQIKIGSGTQPLCTRAYFFMYLMFISFNMFQTLMEGKGDKATAEGMELLRKNIETLKQELKASGDGGYSCNVSPKKFYSILTLGKF